MTQSNLLDLAKQGDTRALTSLLNRSLQSRGIVAKATKRNDTLHILLEAEAPPSQAASVRCIQQGLEKLGLVDTPVTIYGRQAEQTSIAWQEHLTAPINRDEVQSDLFDSELLDDSDSPIPTGGEPTQVSEDWSDQATAIETMDPVPPPPPGIANAAELTESQTGEDDSWDSFDFQAEEVGVSNALDDAPVTEASGFGAADDSWGAGMPVDYSPEDPEPTLIVPDEGDEDLDGSLGDEDADSEILLSLWDDANLAEDDLDTSGDVSVDNLQLWQEGESEGQVASLASEDQPMLVGEPSGSSKRGDRKAAAVPLIFLLGLLAMLGGVATAARLGAFNPPWLASIPGVGPLLVNSKGSGGEDVGASSDGSSPDGSASEQQNDGGTVPDEAADGGDADTGPTDPEATETASESSSGGEGSASTAEAQPSGSESPDSEGSTEEGSGEVAVSESEETTDESSLAEADVTEDQPDTESASGSSPGEATEALEASVGDNFDPFRKAVNAAQTAANLTQTASTSQDWSEVSDYWSIAVENMQAVPKNHPRYDTAQQKVSEYQGNLAYAQQFFQ